jgi:PAS domain S-box-containing protein
MNDAAIVLDSRDRIVEMNPAALRLFKKREDAVIGQPVATVFSVAPNLIDTYRAAYEAQDSLTLGKGEDAQTYEFRISAIFRQEELIGRLVVLHDITERKKAEIALRESEQRYRLVSELSTDYAFAYTVLPDGSLVTDWVTDAAERITGISADEWHSSKHFTNIVFPNDRPITQKRRETVLSGQPVTTEFRLVKPDGKIVWLRSHSRPVWDTEQNRVVRIYGAGKDITERKQAEEALRESEEMARALLNAPQDSVFMVTPNGLILASNEMAAERYGKRPEELVGTNIFDLMPPDLVKARNAIGDEVVRTGKPIHFEDERAGMLFETTVYPVFDTHKNVSRLAIIARDVTEQKQAEQNRLDLALERERVQILANFITQAAHEFRTPLSTINTSTYLMKKSTNPTFQQRYIHTIQKQTRDITRLINDLLTMSRLDSQASLPVKKVNLTELLRSVYNTRQNALDTKTVQCCLELSDSLVVQGDAFYLTQAIERLLDNAIQFTPENGQITMQAESLNDYIQITISDTGLGIQGDDLPHIFERFYRADKAGTIRGFGLGLSIAKSIITLHGGCISVESDGIPGKGATFHISLPV